MFALPLNQAEVCASSTANDSCSRAAFIFTGQKKQTDREGETISARREGGVRKGTDWACYALQRVSTPVSTTERSIVYVCVTARALWISERE